MEQYDFMVECDASSGDFDQAITQLKDVAMTFQIISRDHHDNMGERGRWVSLIVAGGLSSFLGSFHPSIPR